MASDDVLRVEHAENDRDCVLQVRGLSKLSLRNLNLFVERGERVAIIGRTGEGKSVLLKCVIGLLRPDSGTVEVLGNLVNGSVLSSDGVGIAFQNPGLFDALSIRRNIELAAGEALADEELREWLAALDLARLDPEGSVSELSGGQAKRLALLRAIVRGWDLVILDEPTSGLDPATSERVAELLARVLSKDGRTLLLVTHDYESAARLCTGFHLLTPAGSLEEIEVPSFAPLAEKIRRLRSALAANTESRAGVAQRRPAPWSVSGLTADLLAHSLPITAAAMALLGVMLVTQSSGISPIDISRHVPGIVVWAVFREVAPLVIGLLLAGRVGARVAAEVAGMSYTAQIASMRVLGLSPVRHLYVPFFVSAAIVFPLCVLVGAYAGILAGAASVALSFSRLSIGASRFVSLAVDALSPALFVSGVIKGLLMAFAVTTCSYVVGVAPMDSAQSVGTAVTRSVVIGSLSIVAVDVLVSSIVFAR